MSRRFVSLALIVLAGALFTTTTAMAQDAVKVDPKHYKVVLENKQVRVLRITYGPHEKSVMHSHPGGVAIFMTDSDVRFTTPDGKTVEQHGKAGQAVEAPAGKHLPENIGNKPFEIILVELKSSPKKK